MKDRHQSLPRIIHRPHSNIFQRPNPSSTDGDILFPILFRILFFRSLSHILGLYLRDCSPHVECMFSKSQHNMLQGQERTTVEFSPFTFYLLAISWIDTGTSTFRTPLSYSHTVSSYPILSYYPELIRHPSTFVIRCRRLIRSSTHLISSRVLQLIPSTR